MPLPNGAHAPASPPHPALSRFGAATADRQKRPKYRTAGRRFLPAVRIFSLMSRPASHTSSVRPSDRRQAFHDTLRHAIASLSDRRQHPQKNLERGIQQTVDQRTTGHSHFADTRKPRLIQRRSGGIIDESRNENPVTRNHQTVQQKNLTNTERPISVRRSVQ